MSEGPSGTSRHGAPSPSGFVEATPGSLRERWHRQRTALEARGAPDYRARRDSLDRLLELVLAREDEWVRAVTEDVAGRPHEETRALEIFPTVDAIRHAKRHLREWMRLRPVPVGWAFLPARAHIQYQPLGIVGIIGAWNYPLLLNLTPLICALAAGNHVMVKPSELAPRTAELLRDGLADIYAQEQVAVVLGGPEVAAAFSKLPFDHLLFTGSAHVGREIMRAASVNLTPVTLELGGKSPVVIHRAYPLAKAVARILPGKLFNAGQTCLAPDYVLLPNEQRQRFIDLVGPMIRRLYPRLVADGVYTRILRREHYRRLHELVADAREKGADVHTFNPAGEELNEDNKIFPPTVLADVRDDMRIMQEEIFGPLLPLVDYTSLEEAVDYVNARPRPLALYYFDRDPRRVEDVLARTLSGGVTVNDVLLHIAQNHLPFGGVGESGMGHYRGFHGFETFSKKRGVFWQSRWAVSDLVRPPYRRLARGLVRFLIGRKW